MEHLTIGNLLTHPLGVALVLATVTAGAAWVRHRIRLATVLRGDVEIIKAALVGSLGNEYGIDPHDGLVRRVTRLEDQFRDDGNGSMRSLVEVVADGIANVENATADFQAVITHNAERAEADGLDGLRKPRPFRPVVNQNRPRKNTT
jgi:hypothetical protein